MARHRKADKGRGRGGYKSKGKSKSRGKKNGISPANQHQELLDIGSLEPDVVMNSGPNYTARMAQEYVQTSRNRKSLFDRQLRNKPPIVFVKAKEVYDPSVLLNLRILNLNKKTEKCETKEENKFEEENVVNINFESIEDEGEVQEIDVNVVVSSGSESESESESDDAIIDDIVGDKEDNSIQSDEISEVEEIEEEDLEENQEEIEELMLLDKSISSSSSSIPNDENLFMIDTEGDQVDVPSKSVNEILNDIQLLRNKESEEKASLLKEDFKKEQEISFQNKVKDSYLEITEGVRVGSVLINGPYIDLPHSKLNNGVYLDEKIEEFSESSEEYEEEYLDDEFDDDFTLEDFMSFGKNINRRFDDLNITSSLKAKGKGKRKRLILNDTTEFDQDIIEAFQTRQAAKARKNSNRMERRELKKGLLSKYPYSMHIKEIKMELESLLQNYSVNSMSFPPMDNHGVQTVQKMARFYGLKSRKLGNGNQSYAHIIKTKATKRATPQYDMINRMLHQRPIFGRSDVKKEAGEILGKHNKSKVGKSKFQVKEGELVGEKAPELGQENKGRLMLEKLGWKVGEGLGADNAGISEPVMAKIKISKVGIK